MFGIYFQRFKHYYLDLDAVLNNFLNKKLCNSNIFQQDEPKLWIREEKSKHKKNKKNTENEVI